MSPQRKVSLVSLVVVGLLASAADCAPARGPGPGAAPPGGSGHGGYRPSHPGGHYRPGAPGRYGHYGHWSQHGYYYPYWGWGLGVAIATPWAFGWVDPYWQGYPSYSYSPPYAFGGAYSAYPYGCGLDEDCWRAQQPLPVAPTTQVPPLAAGADGGPTERPLHLNYCDSARGWFPYVRTCPGGWRLVLPEYNPAR